MGSGGPGESLAPPANALSRRQPLRAPITCGERCVDGQFVSLKRRVAA